MPDPITGPLADMGSDTIEAQPVVLDDYGDFMASGEAINVEPCYISTRTVLVRDPQGREVTSTAQVTVLNVFGLTVDGHRYTLPARFSPRKNLTPINVKHVSDENGPHHEVVFFS